MIVFQRDESDKHGTRGRWYKDGLLYCYTLEPETPVLPAGKYILQWYYSPKHKMHVPRYISLESEKWNEENHCIEVHPGNIYVDTEGCTLPGSGFGSFNCAITWPNSPTKSVLGIVQGVLSSKETFQKIISEIYLGKVRQNEDGTENYFGGSEIHVI